MAASVLFLIFCTFPLVASPALDQSEIADLFSATANCAIQQSCDACYGHSALCHWCPDEHGNVTNGSCSVRFTGCQVGASCAGDDCGERRTCSACSMGGCKWCGGVSTQTPCVAMYSFQCALPAQCYPNTKCIRGEPEFFGYSEIPRRLVFAIVGVFSVSLVLFYFARNKLATLFLSTGLALSAAVIFKPEIPEISVCNAELLWQQSLISLATRGSVNMEILISVLNPSRTLGVRVKSIDGLLNYRKLFPVGNFRLSNLTVEPGFVADQVGVLEISTTTEIVTQMLYDFNVAHSLVFSVDPLVVEFELSLFRSPALTFPVLARLPPVLVDANKPPLQRLCHCQQTSDISPSLTES